VSPKQRLVDCLKPEEAAEILRRLLAARPDLAGEAEQTARALLVEVAFEEVADEVEGVLAALDPDEFHGRAGRHDWGYVEPGEAAWQMVEEAVEPFVDDMKRRMRLGHAKEALEICKGVLLGLYRAERGEGERVVDCAPDAPAEVAMDALDTWLREGTRKKRPARAGGRQRRPAFPSDFVNHYLPEWSAMIARSLRRRTRA